MAGAVWNWNPFIGYFVIGPSGQVLRCHKLFIPIDQCWDVFRTVLNGGGFTSMSVSVGLFMEVVIDTHTNPKVSERHYNVDNGVTGNAKMIQQLHHCIPEYSRTIEKAYN